MLDHPTLTRRSFLVLTGTAAALTLVPTRALGAMTRVRASTILPWTELSEGIHAIADLSLGGNTMVVADGPGVLLVDTKFAHLAYALVADAHTLSSGESSLTLVNTHHHGDHTSGNGFIVPNASKSYAHKNAIPRIEAQLDRMKLGAQGGPAQVGRMKDADPRLLELAAKAADESDALTTNDIAPHSSIGSNETITIGATKVELHHFGAGHTDNDVVVHLPDRNVLHTGDLVFHTLHPFFDPEGGYSAKGWIVSLKHTRELCDSDTIVIPGHGPIGDRASIDAQISYLESIIEEVQRAIDSGKSKEETQAMSWGFMDGLGFEQIRERAIGAVYDELSK